MTGAPRPTAAGKKVGPPLSARRIRQRVGREQKAEIGFLVDTEAQRCGVIMFPPV